MKLSECLKRERQLATERSLKYWGTASVDIDILDFPCEEDEENVEKLVDLFRADCRNLNPRYHIPAKVDKHKLDAALALSKLTFQQLRAGPDPEYGYPVLKFPPGFRLECRHGIHRAKAATRVLPPEARRWLIDLYDSGRIPPRTSHP